MHENVGEFRPRGASVGQSLASRIRALRKSMDLSQARFAERVGVDQSNVSRWENGAVPDDVHILRLAALAGVHPAAFRYGGVPEPAGAPRAATVPVVGYVGAGQEIFAHDDHALGGGLEEVEAPEGVGEDPIVAVRIRGESMHPMRDGWLLFYRRDQQGVPEACLNRLCIVKLAGDGPILVKEVRRGYRPNHFVLTSWNAPPLEDVRLDWAAEVLSIRP
jgi:transcriptional regulator with XRE-family HTH domain